MAVPVLGCELGGVVGDVIDDGRRVLVLLPVHGHEGLFHCSELVLPLDRVHPSAHGSVRVRGVWTDFV